MNRQFSLYLDIVRFVAAFVVVLSHFAYPRFTGGTWIVIRELNLGSDAVVLFFVLSGFVIAFVAAEKEGEAGTFFFNRATRIYSVAIPAVVLTLVLDKLGSSINPAAYQGWWYNEAPVYQSLWKALTFTNEWGFDTFRIGTNGPYWSVGYEVWYYVLFGLTFYYKSPIKYAALAAMAFLIGPKILLLMPAWLLGVVVYRIVASGLQLSRTLVLLLTFAPPAIYVTCLKLGIAPYMLAMTQAAFGEGFVTFGLKFSNEFIWNGYIGVLAALHFTGVAYYTRQNLAKKNTVGIFTRNTALIRWLAGGTFSLYLVHYPLLQFVDALLPDMAWLLRDGILLTVVVMASLLFAGLFERTLKTQRAMLRRLQTTGTTKANA